MTTFHTFQKIKFTIERAGKKQHFTEQQLWYLLLAIFTVKKRFSELKINQGNLGNINTQNIFYSQKGQIKVGNILSWPSQQHNMQRDVSSYIKRFLAPQDFIQISMGMNYCRNTNTSEMFAIGLTVLSAGILKDSFQLYNYQSNKFNFNQALNRLKIWKQKTIYSDILKVIVQLLCAFDQSDRLKLSQIGQILFRYENSIKTKKKFSVYPVADKIQNKLRQYRSSHVSYNLSNIYPANSQQITPESPTNSKFFNLKKNSLNLTQVIFAHHNNNMNDRKSSNKSQSLISSVDQLPIKKTQSDPNQDKPLQRYQQINAANSINNSLSEMDYLNLINVAKQIIVQKPIVIDGKRRSDDIQEQTTPFSTPTQTPLNRSIVQQQKQRGFNRSFHVPRQVSKDSLNFIQINPLYKTTLDPKKLYDDQRNFRVKSAKSHQQWNFSNKQDISKSHNPNITMYIPLSDSLGDSLRSSWFSQTGTNNKINQQKSKPPAIPYQILQNQKQSSSQIQISKLSQEDKQKIETQILQKIEKQNNANRKLVKFAQNSEILDVSHESKILEIEDIDLDCMQESNKYGGDKIVVGYKQPNQQQIVIESVNISKKPSFVYIDDQDQS